jgi:hypothetical protein
VALKSNSEGDILQRKVQEGSITLDKHFIFGLIDSTVEESMELPLFSVFVSKENFLQT